MVQFLGGSGGPEIESMDSQFLLHNRFHWIAVVYVMKSRSVEKGREYRKMKVELQLQKESKLQIVVKVLEYY